MQAVKLEDLERRLRGDMLLEAQRWGGKILLHREVALPAAVPLLRLEGTPGAAGCPPAQRRGCIVACRSMHATASSQNPLQGMRPLFVQRLAQWS